MEYIGFINWGPVTAFITITDIIKIDGHIASAEATITINGQSKVLTFEPPLD